LFVQPANKTGKRPATIALAFAALAASVWGSAALLPSYAQGKKEPEAAFFASTLKPAMDKYCVRCHGKGGAGGVDLTTYPDAAAVQRNPDVWRRVAHQLTARSMPPANALQPSPDESKQITGWIADWLDAGLKGAKLDNPGRVTIHRLSRTEYNNTIRDLLQIDTHPADSFPADGGGGSGFDNNADTLFIPPILMERYVTAAADSIQHAKSAHLLPNHPGKGITEQAAAARNLVSFANLAYRRPADAEDAALLMKLYTGARKKGMTFEQAQRYALTAVLVSPKFLYRIEPEPRNAGKGAYALDDYSLASRLSYFLWASMPDAVLFKLAAQGALHRPEVLDAQVTRMLADPRAHAFAESFGSQWLRIRDLYTTAQPDPGRFPTYTPALRDAMYSETVEFLQSVFRDNHSVLDLIDADYTYLNQPLAAHYGIPGVTGSEMRRVALPDHRRGGVLTMASVLTITSYAERTSPVLRGKWVLEQVLGTPPPPPPPNAGGLSQDDSFREGLTFRQRLEKHRQKPQCASCHSTMDPIGFGLENFDAIGRWRSELGGKPVDASGVLADGSRFEGPTELKNHIAAARAEFVQNLTEKMLGYALGRGLEEYDRASVKQIADKTVAGGYRSGTLIREIVKSYPFRYRMRAEGAGKAPAGKSKEITER
jgi:mono/diheme cytochrome c family protein